MGRPQSVWWNKGSGKRTATKEKRWQKVGKATTQENESVNGMLNEENR